MVGRLRSAGRFALSTEYDIIARETSHGAITLVRPDTLEYVIRDGIPRAAGHYMFNRVIVARPCDVKLNDTIVSVPQDRQATILGEGIFVNTVLEDAVIDGTRLVVLTSNASCFAHTFQAGKIPCTGTGYGWRASEPPFIRCVEHGALAEVTSELRSALDRALYYRPQRQDTSRKERVLFDVLLHRIPFATAIDLINTAYDLRHFPPEVNNEWAPEWLRPLTAALWERNQG